VVHGIPNEQPKILKEGDVVSLDMGLVHKGMITDMAVTIPVGVIDEKAKKLLEVTEKGLSAGIKVVKVGGTTGDIGAAIETHANKAGFGIVRELAGHGVGYAVHEDPYVPNYGKKGEGTKLRAGMVIAIEPMFNEGGDDVVLGEDGYTYTTRDGSRSAHFEHTVLITEKGAEILTII
jgi:methionyl aminopeptidase